MIYRQNVACDQSEITSCTSLYCVYYTYISTARSLQMQAGRRCYKSIGICPRVLSRERALPPSRWHPYPRRTPDPFFSKPGASINGVKTKAHEWREGVQSTVIASYLSKFTLFIEIRRRYFVVRQRLVNTTRIGDFPYIFEHGQQCQRKTLLCLSISILCKDVLTLLPVICTPSLHYINNGPY